MTDCLTSFKIDIWALGFIVTISLILLVTGFSSALIYTGFFLICFFIGCFLDNAKSFLIKVLCFCFLVLFCTLFSGFRDFGVGTDTNVYILSYYNESKAISSLGDFFNYDYGEKGFLGLTCCARFFYGNPQGVLILTAFVYSFFTFLAVAKLNEKGGRVCWSTFLFVWLFYFYNMSMNAMKQYCAMSILLIAFVYLLNHRWLKSLLLIVPASFFHSSSVLVLLIFLPYLFSFVSSKKIRRLLMALFMLASLFFVVFIFKFLPILNNIGLVSDKYLARYGSNIEYESANIFGPCFLVFWGSFLFLILITLKKKKISARLATVFIGVHMFCFIFRLAAFSVVYLARMSEYWFYFDFLILCILLKVGTSKYIRFLLYLCIVYLWVKSYIWYPGAQTYPYISSILGITG